MSELVSTFKSLKVEPGKLAISWLGGAGFIFKTSTGKVVYIDPYLSDALDHYYSWKRLPGSPILILPEEVEADLVLITHAHEDHLDPEALPQMVEASNAIFCGPPSCVAAMRGWNFPEDRLVEIEKGEQKNIAGMSLRAVLAHHVSNAGAQTPDAVGFVLDLDGITVYHTGDTLYHEHLQDARDFRPDVLLVCINGGYGNMGPQEAAQLVAEIDPAVVVPMHWGLVAENTSNPLDFVKSLVETGCQARPVVMAPGDLYLAGYNRIY